MYFPLLGKFAFSPDLHLSDLRWPPERNQDVHSGLVHGPNSPNGQGIQETHRESAGRLI